MIGDINVRKLCQELDKIQRLGTSDQTIVLIRQLKTTRDLYVEYEVENTRGGEMERRRQKRIKFCFVFNSKFIWSSVFLKDLICIV